MCTGIPAVKVSNLIHQEIPEKLPGGAFVTLTTSFSYSTAETQH